MSNMSYCRFQNTLIDFDECLENIDDENLSTDETRARKKLIKSAMDFILEAMDADLISEEDVANHLGFEYDGYDIDEESD